VRLKPATRVVPSLPARGGSARSAGVGRTHDEHIDSFDKELSCYARRSLMWHLLPTRPLRGHPPLAGRDETADVAPLIQFQASRNDRGRVFQHPAGLLAVGPCEGRTLPLTRHRIMFRAQHLGAAGVAAAASNNPGRQAPQASCRGLLVWKPAGLVGNSSINAEQHAGVGAPAPRLTARRSSRCRGLG
jgi:hypothetical protein